MIFPIAEVIPDELERYVYHVASRTRAGKRYRVDLTANNGAMQCACPDFSARRQPAIDRSEPFLTKATTCYHGRKALRHFNLGLLPALEKTA